MEEEVSTKKASTRRGPDAAEIAKYPKWETHGSNPGTKEGEVKVFNKDGKAIAAQWSMDSRCWIEMGEVTGSSGESIDGVSYDVVLPVEIETTNGLQTLRLGYNHGQNPFVAAQHFIDTYGLQQSYLSQIADWVTQQVGSRSAPTFDMSAPGNGNGSSSEGSSRSDSGSVPAPLVGQPTSLPPTPPKHRFLPLGHLLNFTDVPNGLQSKLLSKLIELNAEVGPEALSSSELVDVERLVGTLADTSHYHSTSISSSEVASVQKCCSWSNADKLFPCFDLARLVAGHPSGLNALAAGPMGNIIANAVRALNLGPSCAAPTALTASRFLCNVIGSVTAPQAVGILGATMMHSSSSNKLVRAAVAAFMANFTLIATKSGDAQLTSSLGSVLSVAQQLLDSEAESLDVVIRSCLALGTAGTTIGPAAAASGLKSVLDNTKRTWGPKLAEKVQLLDEVVETIGL